MATIPSTVIDYFLRALNVAVDGVSLPREAYLNFLTSGSGPPVDNPTGVVDGQVVGTIDCPLTPGSGGGGSEPVEVEVSTAGGVSTASLPVGRAWKVLVKITTSFSAGATAAVGSSASHTAIASGIDLTQPAGVYPYDVLATWAAAAPVLVTVSGSPSVGAAEFLVFGGATQS